MFPPMRDRESLYTPLELHTLPIKGRWQGKIAYLDRDGVIIRGFEDYVNSPDEVEVLAGAPQAIGDYEERDLGYVSLLTNLPLGGEFGVEKI